MALLALATAAHADLYRWVDPQSGSVKLSNVPPPPSQAGVEVLPYRAAPAKPSGAAALEQRWHELLDEIARGGAAAASGSLLQRQLGALAAASAELDRLDPAGAARRRAQAQSVLQGLLKGAP